MARTSVTFRANDSRIMLLGADGHMVGRYIRRKGNDVQRWAVETCPKRSGELARSISSGNFRHAGHHTTIDISADAGYAIYVHDGTGPQVGRDLIIGRPKGGLGAPHGMLVPVTKGSSHRAWRQEVQGQVPQPFLRDALVFVMSNSRFVRSRGLRGAARAARRARG